MLPTLLAGAALAAWVAVLLLPWQPHRVSERLEAARDRPVLDDVTVLIPARNEAAVIERTLAALIRQGAGLDVVVVDDESDDGTGELCRRVAAGAADASSSGATSTSSVSSTSIAPDGTANPPCACSGSEGDTAYPITLRVVSGRPRPAGWSGKLWALEQGLEQVRRPRVLLLDAEIELAPGMIAALVEQSKRTGADLVSIMATLRCSTFAEKLLAPPFVFFFKLLYPFALANSARSRTAAAAGGCMLVSTQALRDLGGFAPLRGALIDDCTLAAALKGRGRRIWLGMSRSVRSQRAYTFGDFWRMVSRTAFTQLRYSPLLLLGTTAAMALVFLAPLAALIAADSWHTAAVAAAAIGAMSLAYLPVVRFYGLPAAWVPTLPLAGALFLGMTWDSAIGYWRGVKARWKDRAYGVAE